MSIRNAQFQLRIRASHDTANDMAVVVCCWLDLRESSSDSWRTLPVSADENRKCTSVRATNARPGRRASPRDAVPNPHAQERLCHRARIIWSQVYPGSVFDHERSVLHE